MKCPKCQATVTLNQLIKSFFKPTQCQACANSIVVTLSIKRGALLLLPVAATLFLVKPLAFQWQVDATFLNAFILFLYGISCLTVRSA